MPVRALGLLFWFAVLCVLPAHADNARLFPAEAAIPNSQIIRFTSAIDKKPYTLQISIPIFAPRPPAGYHVIYVLDGELYFPIVAMESDLLADKAPGDKAAVVVGIGHDALNDNSVIARYAKRKPVGGKSMDGAMALSAFQAMRNYDFTWPVRPEHRAPAFVEKFIGPETGDVDAFLRVIEKEIKPRVEALVPINRNNQALFGHSAGGLAVVHALFTEPNAFHTFIAASPSLWYDGGAVLRDEKYFGNAIASRRAAPRVLITVGALEPDNLAPNKNDLAKFTPRQRVAMVPYSKMLASWPGMVSGARDLAARLKRLNGKPGYEVKFALFPGQNHPNSVYPAIIRALQFAFLDK